MSKTGIEHSRTNYTWESPTLDAINVGSRQRIANAMERLANRGDDIHAALQKLRAADRAIQKRLRALEGKV